MHSYDSLSIKRNIDTGMYRALDRTPDSLLLLQEPTWPRAEIRSQKPDTRNARRHPQNWSNGSWEHTRSSWGLWLRRTRLEPLHSRVLKWYRNLKWFRVKDTGRRKQSAHTRWQRCWLLCWRPPRCNNLRWRGRSPWHRRQSRRATDTQQRTVELWRQWTEIY